MTSSRRDARAELSPCAAELRRHDPDRFLATLFAPADRRESLFALYAFNLEVARTREMVREPMLGRMRLQWWREAIEGLYAGTPRRHYVIDGLAGSIGRLRQSRGEFDRLIDAREFDLDTDPPATMADLVDYAEATSATLIRLALNLLGDDPGSPEGRRRATHVGVAWGLVGLVRAIPFHARAKRLYLPAELIEETGVAVGDLFELRRSAPLAAAVRRIAEVARGELAAARALPRPPRHVLAALLPGTLADLYLRRLASAGYDPFDRRVQEPPPLRAARLVAAQLRGRF